MTMARIVLAAFALFISQMVQAQVLAPKFSVGDGWEYARTDKGGNSLGSFSLAVTKVESDKILISVVTTQGDRVAYEFTPEGNIRNTPRARFEPMLPELKFPLTVGMKWSEHVTIHRSDGRRFREQVNAEVVAEEDVTTPAGTFKAYKVVYLTYDEWTNSFRRTTWYAPSVKMMVKRESDARAPKGQRGPVEVDTLVTYNLSGTAALK